MTPLFPGAPESGVSFAPTASATLMMPVPMHLFDAVAAARAAESPALPTSSPQAETTGATTMAFPAEEAAEPSARRLAAAASPTASPAADGLDLTSMRTVFLLLAGALMLATVARMAVG